jgi:hypothetical protein
MHLLSPGGAPTGERDVTYQEIGSWDSVIVDLGRQTRIGRLVYNEIENPSDPGYIAMDWVIVYVSYVLISAPPRCDDPAQVGGIEVLP